MEYLNFEKSGLITILIPLNFLIGEYTLFFRLNGWSRKIIHLITGVIDLFFVVATIASGEHPYYPFVIFGGMLIGIIIINPQNQQHIDSARLVADCIV